MEVTCRSQHELLTLGHNTPYEKQYIRPDSSRWWGLFAGKRLSTGECVEFVLDITETKQAEQALHHSQQQLQAFNEQLTRTNVDLDNFIYSASHDLKAPITNIEGLLYALQDRLPIPMQQTYDVVPLHWDGGRGATLSEHYRAPQRRGQATTSPRRTGGQGGAAAGD